MQSRKIYVLPPPLTPHRRPRYRLCWIKVGLLVYTILFWVLFIWGVRALLSWVAS